MDWGYQSVAPDLAAALRAGFITGLPRFARNDGDAGLVLERVPLNSGLCVVHCSVRPELVEG